MAVTREDYVEQSVQTYLRRRLFNSVGDGGKGYPEAMIEFIDSFSDDMFGTDEHVSKNYIAGGYDFDDNGKAGELGSDLITRLYTMEFFTVGISSVWARTIAQGIKFSLETDGIIPLLDIEDTDAAPDWPQIDSLVLVGVSANRTIVQDPAPWQRHLWVTTVRVEDTYYAHLT